MDGEHAFSAAIILTMVKLAFPPCARDAAALDVALGVLRDMADKGSNKMADRYEFLVKLLSNPETRAGGERPNATVPDQLDSATAGKNSEKVKAKDHARAVGKSGISEFIAAQTNIPTDFTVSVPAPVSVSAVNPSLSTTTNFTELTSASLNTAASSSSPPHQNSTSFPSFIDTALLDTMLLDDPQSFVFDAMIWEEVTSGNMVMDFGTGEAERILEGGVETEGGSGWGLQGEGGDGDNDRFGDIYGAEGGADGMNEEGFYGSY
jgi:hypothetical protein